MKISEHLKYCKRVAEVLGGERLHNLDRLQKQSLNKSFKSKIKFYLAHKYANLYSIYTYLKYLKNFKNQNKIDKYKLNFIRDFLAKRI